MATKSLEVVIGADTAGLQAKMAIAKASLRQLNTEIRTMAGQAAAAGGEVKATLTAPLTDLTAKAGKTRIEISNLSKNIADLDAEKGITKASGFFNKFHESIRLTGNSLNELHTRLNVVGDAVSAFSGLLIGGLAIGDFAHHIQEIAEQGERIRQAAEEFGGTTRQISGLALAAREAGVPFSQMSVALQALTRSMQEAINQPTSKMARAYQALGLSVTNSNGTLKNSVEFLGEVATALGKFRDGTAKTALAQDILSRRGAELIPVLNEMKGGLGEVSDKAKNLGVSYSAASAAMDEKFLAATRDADQAGKGLIIDVLQPMIPALTTLAQDFAAAGSQGSGFAEVGQEIATALKYLIEVTTALTTGLIEVGDMAFFVGEAMGDADVAAVALAEAMSGNFGRAKDLLERDGHAIAQQWHDTLARMRTQEEIFAKVHKALWDSPTIVKGPEVKLPDAPSIGLEHRPKYAGAHAHGVRHISGGGEVAAARHAAQQLQQIQESSIATAQRVASIKFQTYEQELNKEVAEGKITKSQEIQLEIQAANAEYQAQKTALDKKMALFPQESAAYAKAKDAEVELEASHDRQIAALSAQLAKQQIADAKKVMEAHGKAVQKTVKDYETAMQPIDNAMNQMVSGVLKGTETLQQGMQKAAQSIVMSFVQGAEKLAEHWAAKQIAMLVTTTTTQTAITAAQTAGHAAKAAQDSASIGNDAYKAAAGAYSAVVGIPIVGPVLAPAAAAAAFAGVMAFDVISAEGGMGTVPFNDMPALLHRNEMVLPASIAEPLRIGLPAIAAMPNVGAMMNNQSSTNNSLTYAPNIDASGSGMDMTALESMMMAQQEEMAQLFGVLSNNGSTMLPGR